MEQKFYNAFKSLANSGEFKKGNFQYNLVTNNVITEADAESYVNGGKRVAEAYSAGRDAFYMDHPDLFYADLFSTSLSAGKAGDKYVAYLDTSRTLNTYRGNLDSESAINNAITAYEAAIKTVVDVAETKATAKEKIEYVNSYLKQNVTYGYGTRVEGDRNVDTDKAPFIFTSYGALVNKESVCEGYAKAFKAVMDRLDIPCVCIQGYADAKADETNEPVYEAHMWDYVQVDGHWYMVDPTYNATSTKSWILCGSEAIHYTHVEDGVVSSSGKALEYPALKPYEYGVDTDSNGMKIVGVYKGEGSMRDLAMHVSYNGKGAAALEKENKYLAFRWGKATNDGKITWEGTWKNVLKWGQAHKEALDAAELPYTDSDSEIVIRSINTEYVQFALVDHAPDKSEQVYPLLPQCPLATFAYEADNLGDIDPTVPYRNDVVKDSETPAPYGASVSPSNTAALPYDKTHEITITYSEELKLLNDAISDFPNGQKADMGFNVSVSNDIAQEKAKVEDFHWDGDKTITFKFTPSHMFIHSDAVYNFTPENLVGKESNKIPDPVRFNFKGKSVVCSKVFNDGRMFMKVFGTPKLLDNSDVSVTDFKDENGKYYAESQRSQLMLVATKKDSTNDMDTMLKDEMHVEKTDVLASSTYEIDLQICGMIRKVPNGSYMQVSFGFPEGYSKDDAGTTFKIYHYKHDAGGNITGVEEIPVIVTEYGLIAQVKSFSPFTIVQLKNTSAAVTNSNVKNIYANVNGGQGGTVKSGGKSGIISVEGDTVTYDITPDSGYTVASVLLNGKLLKASDYQNGKLTINKSELSADNMLEVSFVSQSSANYYKEQGVQLAYNGTVSEPISITNPDNNGGPNVAGIAIGVVVGVIALGGGAFLIWWFLVKNKKQTEGADENAATPEAPAAQRSAKKKDSKEAKPTDKKK